MVKVVGVRFRSSGKVYYFDPDEMEFHSGEHVIVETARGLEYGTVVGGMREIHEEAVQAPLKKVIRQADEEDEQRAERNREKEKEAMVICREKIRKHNLEMKLIDAEYTFDNNKILFYFTADGRIDFRELVKDLAGVFRTRIELRQIGVRDETKILGGIGICGRALCCHTWLTDFVPVSIRMAKEQNLSLNPTKISGVCGRLMCCLKNEESTYEYLNSKLPAVGSAVTTPSGATGEVHSVSVLRQKVKVVVENGDEKEIQEYDATDLQFRARKKKERREGKENREIQEETGPQENKGVSRKEKEPSKKHRTRSGKKGNAEKDRDKDQDKERDREKERKRERDAGKARGRASSGAAGGSGEQTGNRRGPGSEPSSEGREAGRSAEERIPADTE